MPESGFRAPSGQPPEGYRTAGRMTIGYDGGNFSIKSAVLACEDCGDLVLPPDAGNHSGSHAEGAEEVLP